MIDLERPQDGCDDGGGARGHGVLRGEERDEHRQLDVQALLSVVSESFYLEIRLRESRMTNYRNVEPVILSG